MTFEVTPRDMPTMNVSLPERLKSFVESEVASGKYGSASDYVRDLIRRDEQRKEQERLEALLLEGLESDTKIMTRDDWDSIRREAAVMLAKKRETNTT